MQKELLNKFQTFPGWGENFEGWISYDWISPLITEKVRDWNMQKILDNITGEQFIKEFCGTGGDHTSTTQN